MEILNKVDQKVNEDIIREAIEFVLKMEGVSGDVSVAIVGVEEMADLNERYRGKNGPTDVLSFPYGDELLGEIVMCPEVIRENAHEFENTFEEELLLTSIHAALHLCGYDHERSMENADEMFQKQGEYFEKLKGDLLKRPSL